MGMIKPTCVIAWTQGEGVMKPTCVIAWTQGDGDDEADVRYRMDPR